MSKSNKTGTVIDFRALDEKAVLTQLKTLRAQLREQKLMHYAGQLPDFSTLRKTRRNIARGMTARNRG